MVRCGWLLCLGLAVAVTARAAPPDAAEVADIDLTHAFDTRSPWRFTATQAPAEADPDDPDGDKLPGAITLCLGKGGGPPCGETGAFRPFAQDGSEQAHYLELARVVRPAAGERLLLVQEAGLHSGDGDQLFLTQLLAYRRDTDRFVRVYDHATGKNNNQEVRLIESGPLAGAVVSAEPTEDAPYAFWIVVNRMAAGQAFKPVLRYRSATRYGDDNPLAVIDSEMPNMEAHMGLWHPGSPLPVPATGCPKPHLIRMELWCK